MGKGMRIAGELPRDRANLLRLQNECEQFIARMHGLQDMSVSPPQDFVYDHIEFPFEWGEGTCGGMNFEDLTFREAFADWRRKSVFHMPQYEDRTPPWRKWVGELMNDVRIALLDAPSERIVETALNPPGHSNDRPTEDRKNGHWLDEIILGILGMAKHRMEYEELKGLIDDRIKELKINRTAEKSTINARLKVLRKIEKRIDNCPDCVHRGYGLIGACNCQKVSGKTSSIESNSR